MRLFIILIGFLISFISFGSDYEHIISYHSDIHIQKSCQVLVIEKIKVNAQGYNIKRGIFRELPLSYQYKGGNYHVDFELVSVKRDGVDEPFHTEWKSNGIAIYAGDKDVYLSPGVYEYEITYVVDHVLGFFDEYDELYWNVNGNGWAFSIDSISATVFYPEGAEYVQDTAYTGAFGEAGAAYRSYEVPGRVHFVGDRMYYAGENMTISLAWTKNHLDYPTGWDNFVYWLKTYALWVVGILGILIGLIYNLIIWNRYGRDPKPGTIIPLYYPPNGFSPAECAYLKNNGRKTKEMFGGNLISLAVKGYVDIDVDEKKGWGKSTSFTITEAEGREKKPLNDIEEYFLGKLLGRVGSVTIKKGKYNSKVANANTGLIARVDKKQKGIYYLRNNHLKGRQFIFPLMTGIASGIAYWLFGGFIVVSIVVVVLQVLMNIVFAYLFEQPTKEGRQKMDEIAGFEMYMKYADKERIRLTNPPTMNFQHFEENLAYAIALGVAEEWSGQFDPKELEDFRTHHMPYYHGAAIASFTDFSSTLNSTISSASVPPSSSVSSSGGGGFSGGGGGGGGGGGW